MAVAVDTYTLILLITPCRPLLKIDDTVIYRQFNDFYFS